MCTSDLWANDVARTTARSEPGADNAVPAVTLCGRVPIFAPALCKPTDHSLGLCLSVMRSGGGNATWRLTRGPEHLRERVAACVKILLAHGANKNAKNRDGQTPLSIYGGVTGVAGPLFEDK